MQRACVAPSKSFCGAHLGGARTRTEGKVGFGLDGNVDFGLEGRVGLDITVGALEGRGCAEGRRGSLGVRDGRVQSVIEGSSRVEGRV